MTSAKNKMKAANVYAESLLNFNFSRPYLTVTDVVNNGVATKGTAYRWINQFCEIDVLFLVNKKQDR